MKTYSQYTNENIQHDDMKTNSYYMVNKDIKGIMCNKRGQTIDTWEGETQYTTVVKGSKIFYFNINYEAPIYLRTDDLCLCIIKKAPNILSFDSLYVLFPKTALKNSTTFIE